MKGDFTRDTFNPDRHYQQVLMQQGRVQLDADWNEQSAIAARRDETTTADIVGDCGGPAEGAAFAIITDTQVLDGLPSDANTPIRQFALSAGRYYVDGIQCEVNSPFLFSWQPDHRETVKLPAGNYLVYLDVWRRHLTMHEDGDIREAALGGPDTGTRVKTVWQVRAAALNAPFDPQNSPPDPCHHLATDFKQRQRAALPRLAAKTTSATPDTDPCTVPAGAGYRGLENQLYRVEIHKPGALGTATFKWSRENGAVVTRITSSVIVPINGVNVNRLTVTSTGPDDNLGFKKGNLVEVIHESEELEGTPGTLALVDDVDATGNIILAKFGTNPMPVNIDTTSNPRLRRWEGSGVVAVNAAVNGGLLALENGVEVRFDLPAGAAFVTGDYWQIPARTASPDAQSGKIEWPGGQTPEFLPPKGIAHHYCRLGVVSVNANGAVTTVSDCRCLWPALTAVPRLFYVSGDGQEVMPDLTAPAGTRFKLPRPLIVGVANAHCLQGNTSVRFDVVNTASSASDGLVVAAAGVPTQKFAIVTLDATGLAKCDYYLDGINPTQQVTARLLDAANHPVSLPIIFNANLSIASQVAYQPGNCANLSGQKTVLDAIARLAIMASVYKLSGDGQQAHAGAKLKEPLRVRVANRCGPVAGMPVVFQVVLGGGSVLPISTTTDTNGEATCGWQLGGDSILQVAEARVADNASRPVTDPQKVHFIAHLATEGANDPAPVRVVGLGIGDKPNLLANDQTLKLAELLSGISVFCNQVVQSDTVRDPREIRQQVVRRGQPTCFLTAEVPFPLTASERRDWDLTQLCAYRPFILHGVVTVDVISSQQPAPDDDKPRCRIVWTPSGDVMNFLQRVLAMSVNLGSRLDKILVRLTLKGNFIWRENASGLIKTRTQGGFLDGETYRAPVASNLLLPSGDNRRGGDFEMWFWLEVPGSPNLRRAVTPSIE